MQIDERSTPELSFEASFTRLEEILEKMNSGTATLDESLKLYEEADRLMTFCNKRLQEAEKKVEMLIKSRNGDVLLGPDQKPQTQEFAIDTDQASRNLNKREK